MATNNYVEATRPELTIFKLLNPVSIEARKHPKLHGIIRERFDRGLGGNQTFSVGRGLHNNTLRYDSPAYQLNVATSPNDSSSRRTTEYKRFKALDEILGEDYFLIRGVMGSGSFGSVFCVHNRQHVNDLYAMKVFDHISILASRKANDSPIMAAVPHGNGSIYYAPEEALLLLLAMDSDRFPNFYDVATEEKYGVIVMSPVLDPNIANQHYENTSLENLSNKYKVMNGMSVMDYEKVTYLLEMQACKVASQILEGIAYLRDMNVSYADLSSNNYLIELNLDTKIIDLGMVDVGIEDSDFHHLYYHYHRQQEQLITHDVITMLKSGVPYVDELEYSYIRLDYPHDVRQHHLWRFSLIAFRQLNGIYPWEDLEWDEDIDVLQRYAEYGINPELKQRRYQVALDRRWRMMNEEFPIDEGLSQDCVDAMRMCLAKDLDDRPNLAEMATQPWWNQWTCDPELDTRRPRKPGSSR